MMKWYFNNVEEKIWVKTPTALRLIRAKDLK